MSKLLAGNQIYSRGIILDLETQRLRAEAQMTLIEIPWLEMDGTPEFVWYDPKFRMWGTFAEPSKEEILKNIRDRGPLQLTPWMHDFLEINEFSNDLKTAVEAAWQLRGEVYYDSYHHELDVEHKYDGRQDVLHRHLRVAVAVTWDEAHEFRTWQEEQVPELVNELASFSFIVGANLIGFDYTVLERYVSDVRARLGFKTIDLLAHARWGLFLAWLEKKLGSKQPITKRRVQLALTRARRKSVSDRLYSWNDISPWSKKDIHVPGYRTSLQALSRATLEQSKFGKATDAPALFAAGKFDELIEYCQKDVELTRNIFRYGCEQGKVKIKDLDIPVRWDKLAQHLIRRKRRKKGPVWESECIQFQYKMLQNTEPLMQLETLFRS